jgi:fucose 4-O-acetylase-like acetyltransferase
MVRPDAQRVDVISVTFRRFLPPAAGEIRLRFKPGLVTAFACGKLRAEGLSLMQTSSVLTIPGAASPSWSPSPASVAQASPIRETKRVEGFDLLRFLAVCAIVWFHAGAPMSEYLSWRLPSLLMLSVFLAATNRRTEGLGQMVARRARRLLAPFVFWCGAYAGVLVLRIVMLGEAPSDVLSPWMILGGTWWHLWFLPFAFVSAVVAAELSRLTAKIAAEMKVLLWLSVSVLLFGASTYVVRTHPEIPWPLPQYLYSVPALPVGLALAAVHAAVTALGERGERTPRAAYLLVPAVMFCVYLADAGEIGGAVVESRLVTTVAEIATRYGLGALALCLAVFVPAGVAAPFSRFTPLAMGVYLLHPMVNLLVLKTGLVGAGTISQGLTVVAGSVVATWALSRTRVKHFM